MNPAVHTLPAGPAYESLETIVRLSIFFLQIIALMDGNVMFGGDPNDDAERPSHACSHRVDLRSLSTPPLGLLYLPIDIQFIV